MSLEQKKKVKRKDGEHDNSTQTLDPLSEILPRVTFKCENRTEGYYPDKKFKCQVFHYCKQDGKRFTFICPPKSYFNQKFLMCVYQSESTCAESEIYLHLNQKLYPKKNITSDKDVSPTETSQKESPRRLMKTLNQEKFILKPPRTTNQEETHPKTTNQEETLLKSPTTINEEETIYRPPTTISQEEIPLITTGQEETHLNSQRTISQEETLSEFSTTTNHEEPSLKTPTTISGEQTIHKPPTTTGEEENLPKPPTTIGEKGNLPKPPATKGEEENLPKPPTTTGEKEETLPKPTTTTGGEETLPKPTTTTGEEETFTKPPTTTGQEQIIHKPPLENEDPPVTLSLRIQDPFKTKTSFLHPPHSPASYSDATTTTIFSGHPSNIDPYEEGLNPFGAVGRVYEKDYLSLSRSKERELPLLEEETKAVFNTKNPYKEHLFSWKAQKKSDLRHAKTQTLGLPEKNPNKEVISGYLFEITKNGDSDYTLARDYKYPQYIAEEYHLSNKRQDNNDYRRTEDGQNVEHYGGKHAYGSRLSTKTPYQPSSNSFKHPTPHNQYNLLILNKHNIQDDLPSTPAQITRSGKSFSSINKHFMYPNEHSFQTNNEHSRPFQQYYQPLHSAKHQQNDYDISMSTNAKKKYLNHPFIGTTKVNHPQLSSLTSISYPLQHNNEPEFLYSLKTKQDLENSKLIITGLLDHPEKQEFRGKDLEIQRPVPNAFFHPRQYNQQPLQAHPFGKTEKSSLTSPYFRSAYLSPSSIPRTYIKKKNGPLIRIKRGASAHADIEESISSFHDLQLKTPKDIQNAGTQRKRHRRQLSNGSVGQSGNSKLPNAFIGPLSSQGSLLPYQQPFLRDTSIRKREQAYPSFEDALNLFEFRPSQNLAYGRGFRQFPAINPSTRFYPELPDVRILQSFSPFRPQENENSNKVLSSHNPTPNAFSQTTESEDTETDLKGKTDQNSERISHSLRGTSNGYNNPHTQQNGISNYRKPLISPPVRFPYPPREIAPALGYGPNPYSGFQHSPFTLSHRPERPSSTNPQTAGLQQPTPSYDLPRPDHPLQFNRFRPLISSRFVPTNNNRPFFIQSDLFQGPAQIPPSRYLSNNTRQRSDLNFSDDGIPFERFLSENNREIPNPDFRGPKHLEKPQLEIGFRSHFSPYGEKQRLELPFLPRNVPGSITLDKDPYPVETHSELPSTGNISGRFTSNSDISRPEQESDQVGALSRSSSKGFQERLIANNKEQTSEHGFDYPEKYLSKPSQDTNFPGGVFRIHTKLKPHEKSLRTQISQRHRPHITFPGPRVDHKQEDLKNPLSETDMADDVDLKSGLASNNKEHTRRFTTLKDTKVGLGNDTNKYNRGQVPTRGSNDQTINTSRKSPTVKNLNLTDPPVSPIQGEAEDVKIPFGVRIETVEEHSESQEHQVHRPRQERKYQPDIKNTEVSRKRKLYRPPQDVKQNPISGTYNDRGLKHKENKTGQFVVVQRPPTRSFSSHQILAKPNIQKTLNSFEREGALRSRKIQNSTTEEPLSRNAYIPNKKQTVHKNSPSPKPLRRGYDSSYVSRRIHDKQFEQDDGNLFANDDDQQEDRYPPNQLTVPRSIPAHHQITPTATSITLSDLPHDSLSVANDEVTHSPSETDNTRGLKETVGNGPRVFERISFRNRKRRPSFARRFRRLHLHPNNRKTVKEITPEGDGKEDEGETKKYKTEYSLTQQPLKQAETNYKDVTTTTTEPESTSTRRFTFRPRKANNFRRPSLFNGPRRSSTYNSRRFHLTITSTSTPENIINPTESSTQETINRTGTKQKRVFSSPKTESGVLNTLKEESSLETTTFRPDTTTTNKPRRVYSSRSGGSLSSTLGRFKKRPRLLSFGRPRLNHEDSNGYKTQDQATTEATLTAHVNTK